MEPKKYALITGASSGIGFELARVFAKNGFNLIINSGSNRINDKASLLRNYEVDVVPVEADLSTQEGVDKLYDEVQKLGSPLDVAVLNAGVGVGGEFYKTHWEEEFKLMNLNIVYLVGLTKKILADMVSVNKGRILFTSSIAAEMPGPYYAVYAASKAFVQSFSEALRYEMEDTKKDIVITALQPGPTDTEFFGRAHLQNTKAGESKKDDPAQVAQEGYDALMSNRDHVVGGSIMNKIQSTAAKFLSEKQGAAAQAKSIKPKSLDQ